MNLGNRYIINIKEAQSHGNQNRQLPGADGKWTGGRRVRAILRGGRQKGGRHVRWQTPVAYHGEPLHVAELTERDADGGTLYHNQWITNIKPQGHNALALARTGRLRWKIGNEEFNSEKNGGYEMEHGYGQRGHAWKNHCLLLQIGKPFNIASLSSAILSDSPPATGRAWQYRLAPD